MESLSQRLKSCLQEGDPIPADFSKLFDCNLFAFDTSLVPEAVQLYERLRVKHEPLRFIAPQFDGAANRHFTVHSAGAAAARLGFV